MAARGKSGWALDLVRQQCQVASTRSWDHEMGSRSQRSARCIPSDQNIMRHFCVAIAYSQGARSAQISELIKTPVFKVAFAGFNPNVLAKRKPDDIIEKYWSFLGHFRFRGKIDQIVECAKTLNDIIQEHGSFAGYLQVFQIPQRIRTTAHFNQFWRQFDALRRDLQHRKMPFFRSTTSLLQLLLDLDYDSVKPDLIVMRLARRIGIVEQETGDRAFRECVRFLQQYSIKQSCRAAELDLAMLAFGGQTGAARLLSEKFCPPKDPCQHPTCALAVNRLCMAHKRLRRDSNLPHEAAPNQEEIG